jgi:serine protease Do
MLGNKGKLEKLAAMEKNTAKRKKRVIISGKLSEKLLLILICLTAGFFGGVLGSKNTSQLSNPSMTVNRQIIASESQLINEIATNVGPSVVSINVVSSTPSRSFFGSGTVDQESAGTGVILSKEGVVITNRHVIPEGTNDISVTLSDGTTLGDVRIIGRTNENDSLDIAFLKINDSKGKTLAPAKLADSSKAKVGDKVVAIGNALGQFQNTVTSGIISGFGRSVQAGNGDGTETETLQNLFQTDTAINQGNSGGPLVNTSGEVLAINTAVAGNAENIGFAIPINDIQGLIKSVLKDGKLLRPYLGVRYISLNDTVAKRLSLNITQGAYLPPSEGQSTIVADSPAKKAGLKENDIIIKIDNTLVDESNSLTSILGRYSVGDSVEITIVRDGKEQKLNATLEAAPRQ